MSDKEILSPHNYELLFYLRSFPALPTAFPATPPATLAAPELNCIAVLLIERL